MFYYIEGVISLIDGSVAVVDCGGVGYSVNTTANSLSRVRMGEKSRLYISPIIREGTFDLYGFATQEEKRCFELLTGVSGVGAKAAQAILSANTPESLSLAILSGNEKALTAAPGIGKKIAQRIILELKDKLAKEQPSFSGDTCIMPSIAVPDDKVREAGAALAVLGYSASEVAAALKGIDMDALPLEEIIRQALKRMVK